jgi:hypothetical protein
VALSSEDKAAPEAVTVHYFKLAFDVARLRRPCSNAEKSMLKTLAARHQS